MVYLLAHTYDKRVSCLVLPDYVQSLPDQGLGDGKEPHEEGVGDSHICGQPVRLKIVRKFQEVAKNEEKLTHFEEIFPAQAFWGR